MVGVKSKNERAFAGDGTRPRDRVCSIGIGVLGQALTIGTRTVYAPPARSIPSIISKAALLNRYNSAAACAPSPCRSYFRPRRATTIRGSPVDRTE